MLKTSYFSNWRKYKDLKDLVPLSIVLYRPKGFNGMSYTPLMPLKELLRKYKQGLIDNKGYEEIYIENVLQKLNAETVYNKLNGCLLLCYERSSDFCHRHIVSKWFNDAGFECSEL